ncbi:MAG: hypothetical protein SCK57_07045 [Bacillota bacterium]|nr:hypothetical protein [Bacillota bacterium]MDW7677403.1 hypothetical protein [Bacillota bacterium]
MDTLIYSVLRITVMILILRTVFRLFSYPRGKKFKFAWKRQESDSQETHAGRSESAEPAVEPVEMVMDKTCQKEIPKHRAFILVDDQDQQHYFSSWECRQKYLAERHQLT